MSIQIRLEPIQDLPETKATYTKGEYALDVRLALGTKGVSEVYVIFDTLTLVFDGASRRLKSLDAYTNMATWGTVDYVPPMPNGFAALLLEESFDDDRISGGYHPKYKRLKDGSLEIELSASEASSCTEIGAGLMVGHTGGEIVSVFISGLETLE